ncbi:hypothetical protein CEXT_247351 [Caerostris extrusa]|uniref:Uncharacterized protein n=1 Tax=Caerostris extrusa TaxID=172846 RepID=A0AAV4NM19_CAEEX|nr:hypothetical protein CEXT_247351 [Caerostris extrusa]
MGSIAVAAFRRDEIMQFKQLLFEIRIQFMGPTALLFQTRRDYALKQLLFEIRIHLWASYFAVACFRRDEIMHSKQLLSRDSNPLMGSTAFACFRRDEIMHLQLQFEIRIHLWALLPSRVSDVTRLCTFLSNY